jgi:hypothetical protein
MLQHLLEKCRITPHLPTIIQHQAQHHRAVKEHLAQLRKALGTKLSCTIMRCGDELSAEIELIGMQHMLIPTIAFSEQLTIYANTQYAALNKPERRKLQACIRRLKKWETKTPLPVYEPPALISAEDYEQTYAAQNRKRERVEGIL